MLTWACQWVLYEGRRIESQSSHPVPLRFILVLSLCLYMVLLSLPFRFPDFLISSMPATYSICLLHCFVPPLSLSLSLSLPLSPHFIRKHFPPPNVPACMFWFLSYKLNTVYKIHVNRTMDQSPWTASHWAIEIFRTFYGNHLFPGNVFDFYAIGARLESL